MPESQILYEGWLRYPYEIARIEQRRTSSRRYRYKKIMESFAEYARLSDAQKEAVWEHARMHIEHSLRVNEENCGDLLKRALKALQIKNTPQA